MKKPPNIFLDKTRVSGELRGEYVEYRVLKESLDTLKAAMQTIDDLKAAHAVELDKLRHAHASALFLLRKAPVTADFLALEAKRAALEAELAEAHQFDVRATNQRPIRAQLGSSLIEHLPPPAASASDNAKWAHADELLTKNGKEAAAAYIATLRK